MHKSFPKKLNLLHIEGIDDEGRGRATHTLNGHDWDCAVRGAQPGIVVSGFVERVWEQRRLIQLRADDRTTSAAHEQCSSTRACPTCPLGHVSREKEIAFKLARVRNAVSHAYTNDTFVHAPMINRNRLGNRIQGRFVHQVSGNLSRLGHFIPHTHLFKEMGMCPFEHPALSWARAQILEALNASHLTPKHRASIQNIRVVILSHGSISATLSLSSALSEQHIDWLWQKLLKSDGSYVFTQLHFALLGSNKNNLLERSDIISRYRKGANSEIGAGLSFVQADPKLAEEMTQLVASLLSCSKEAPILDLYAGRGAFTKALLHAGFKRVHAVESNPAVETSLRALTPYAHIQSVEDFIKTVHPGEFAGAVLDPPRRGLMGLHEQLLALELKEFALVSCSLKSLERDADVLSKHYTLTDVLPVDLFPGTTQVEVVTFWRRFEH